MNAEKLRHFIFDDLGFCACGMPDDAYQFVSEMLRAISDHQASSKEGVETAYENKASTMRQLMSTDGARYAVLYWLDRVGLTEHGGGVDGCWLTRLGRSVLKAMEKYDSNLVLDPSYREDVDEDIR